MAMSVLQRPVETETGTRRTVGTYLLCSYLPLCMYGPGTYANNK